MLRAPRKRGKILQYNNQSLEKAVNAVQAGESIRKASVRFGIPRSTIGDRISGRFDMATPATHGRPPAIAMDIEDKIVSSVKLAAKMGVGLSRKQILTRTHILSKRIKIQSSYTNFKAGKDWWQGVKRRHPELVLRKPEKLSTVRARMLNPSVVDSYFGDLERVVAHLGVGPEEIWNCDETGLNFEHSPPRVVSERGTNCVVGKTSNKSSNITIMACVNAAGATMPPLVITKGKTPKSLHGYKTSDAPAGTVWSYQEKGWITDDIGEKWFDEVFLQNCGQKRPQLLVFDGHSSHETLAIIERAMEANIALLSLPPHCTHFLQPLDRSVFGPFKKSYNEQCANFMAEHPLHVVNKWTFPSLLTRAWQCAFTPSNIKSGFASCGIWPLNRAAIPATAFMPSTSTDVPAANDAPINDALAETVPLQPLERAEAAPLIEQNEHIEPLVDEARPVIDISNPEQLLELITNGQVLMEPIEENGTLSISDISAPQEDISTAISDTYLPPKIESRPTPKAKMTKKTSHVLLTTEEILKQKIDIQQKKNEKEMKRKIKQKSI